MTRFLLAFFLVIGLSLTARAEVQPIDDPGHLLTDLQRGAILSKLMANYDQTKVHVVVWLPALAKDDVLVDKAVAYFKDKGIGQKGVDNGVLLLIDWSNRRSRIEVGYGLEGVMTDAATKSLQDTVMVPFFKKGDLAGGISAGVDQLAQWSAQWAKGETTTKAEGVGGLGWLIGGIVVCGIGLFVIFGFIGARNERLERERRERERVAERARRDREEANMLAAQRAEMAAAQRAYPSAAALAAAAGVGALGAAAYRRSAYNPSTKPTKTASSSRSRSSCSGYSSGGYSSSSCSSRSSCSSSSSSSYDSGGGSSGGGGSDSSW